jgi:hypothetical protein
MTGASDNPATTAQARLYPAPRPRAVAPPIGRLIALALAAGSLTVLVVAARLQPSPSGVGSHQGLGMQRCQLLDRSGVPCPSCGMTTSFSWFARGNVAASFYVQPMGMLMALAAACCVWAGLYVAITGRPAYRLLMVISGRAYLIGLLGFAIAAWGWKIFLQLRGLDGWG